MWVYVIFALYRGGQLWNNEETGLSEEKNSARLASE